jgi:outer membrane immunogenic protein
VGVRQPDDSRASIDTDWYVSLTGRIGYAFDNTLLYLKGGVTGVHTEVSFIDTDPTGLTLVSGTSATDTLWGPTIGGGVEYALSRNFTIRAEYMYVNIDDSISHTALGSNGSTYTFKHEIGDMHTAKIGFTYRF